MFFKNYLIQRTIFSCRLLSSVAEGMKQHLIVPDVVDMAPNEIADVSYSGEKVNLGNELTPTQAKDQPVVYWSADPKTFYTLCLTDPDAPSRKQPTLREWHHWLVGNILGNDVSKGEILSAYIGPGPPKDTGLHRYVFLIYIQSKKLSFNEPRLSNASAEKRGHFSIRKFSQKYKLGQPIAGNLYQGQYDNYVPKLYKLLEQSAIPQINRKATPLQHPELK